MVGIAAAKGSKTTVGRITLTLVDDSRPAPEIGAPNRTLETVVSYPKRPGRAPQKLPLVFFATGFGGTATNYAPMYDHWVRAGYAVAAPTFPNGSANPGDVRFVLDEILRLNGEKRSKLYRLFDTQHIALVGKSLGAITALQVGYDPAQRDPRFVAVVSMTGTASGGVDFGSINTPLLLVHGDADELVPVDGSRNAYANAQSPKFLVVVFGSTHTSAFQGGMDPASNVVNRAALDFLDRYVRNKKGALDRLQRDAAVDGVASLEASP